MTTYLSIFLLVCILILAVGIAWRLISRRASLPCPAWLSWMLEINAPFPTAFNTHSIVERLELEPGMKVLDAGCGPGRLTIPIGKRIGAQGEVVAIDVQAEMLRKAKERARSAGLTNVEFVCGEIGACKLGGDRFDRALLVTVLGEIPDRQGALREIFDALKPGGFLSITEIIFDPHYQSSSTILRLASAIGFKERSFSGNRMSFTVNLEKACVSEAKQRSGVYIPVRERPAV